MTTLLAAILSFLLLHFAVARAVSQATAQPFATVFRLARGLASLVLAAVGFYALVRWRAAFSQVYVVAEPDALASQLVFIPVGHFLADFLLLGYGLWSEKSKPRTDLIIHHGLGLVAATLTYFHAIAAPLYLILFTTELMPVTTGISGYGSYRQSPRLERLGAQLRLVVLLAWRIPLWLWVGGQIAENFLRHKPSHEATIIYGFSSLFLLVTLSLDAYWTKQSFRALRRMQKPLATESAALPHS